MRWMRQASILTRIVWRWTNIVAIRVVYLVVWHTERTRHRFPYRHKHAHTHRQFVLFARVCLYVAHARVMTVVTCTWLLVVGGCMGTRWQKYTHALTQTEIATYTFRHADESLAHRHKHLPLHNIRTYNIKQIIHIQSHMSHRLYTRDTRWNWGGGESGTISKRHRLLSIFWTYCTTQSFRRNGGDAHARVSCDAHTANGSRSLSARSARSIGKCAVCMFNLSSPPFAQTHARITHHTHMCDDVESFCWERERKTARERERERRRCRCYCVVWWRFGWAPKASYVLRCLRKLHKARRRTAAGTRNLRRPARRMTSPLW